MPAKKKHVRGATDKEQRQYEHIKESAQRSGRYGGRAKEVAARTVMKNKKKKTATSARKKTGTKRAGTKKAGTKKRSAGTGRGRTGARGAGRKGARGKRGGARKGKRRRN
jgi:hypothetical protein